MKAIALAVSVLAALVLTPAAGAVDNGVPDGDRHPNVGMLGFADADGDSPPSFWCSGSVLSDRVFLTAAHCIDALADDDVQWVAALAPGSPANPVYVPGVLFEGFPYAITAPVHRPLATIVHPRFEPETLAHDLAVLVFASRTFDVRPVTLPRLRLLDHVARHTPRPHRARFTLVGYGADPDYSAPEPRYFVRGYRQTATAPFAALTPGQLHLQGADVSGEGGLCLGDSGSPQFLRATNVAVSQLSAVGDTCRQIVAQRLDTRSERRFLARFVRLR